MFSLRISSGDTTAAAPAPATSSPKFPTYLLPTFTIPFRRRRRQNSTASYGSSPRDDAVPSLSSTPTSSILSSPVGSPATPSFRTASSSEDRRRSSSIIEPLDTTKLTQTQPDTIRCSTCAADFAFCSQIVSKGFTGRYGRAYLVSPPPPQQQHSNRKEKKGHGAGELTNIKVGKSETRLLVTGSHVVADITCAVCHAKVGWKYVDAKEESQKYKVGKFILETQRCVDHRSWEDATASELPEIQARKRDPLAPLPADDDDGGGGSDDDGNGSGDTTTVVFDSDDEDECEDLFSGTWDPQIAARRRSRKVNQRSKKG